MFHQARLKLTAWYLVIIMIISLSFSGIIYFAASREFNRILYVQQFRQQNPQIRPRPFEDDFFQRSITNLYKPDPEVIKQARIRVLAGLFGINLIVFILSSMAAYFLAGRTLTPIKKMVDEQNRFITDASHELNTPLTALKTSMEVNLRDKKLNLEKAKNVLQSNLDDVDSLQLLSDELIGLAKYQKPNGSLNFEKVLLSQIIQKAIEKIKPLANKKNILITTKIPNVYVKADTKSLTELFVILLDNAVKYSKDKKPITITAQKSDSKVKIKVADKGIGITKEDLRLIFDRFYRADKSRTKQGALGYGLGLSIAKRIVILHQGIIDVESNLDKGTVFIIDLPTV